MTYDDWKTTDDTPQPDPNPCEKCGHAEGACDCEPCCREPKDKTCQHGAALDVHCCNCHSGFLFYPDSCVCAKDGLEAREAFLAKVRARRQDGPYFADYGGGFGSSTVVTGPTLRAGFILQSAHDKRPEDLAYDLNGAWAVGYEQALVDSRERSGLDQIHEILTRYINEPNVVIAAAVRPEIRRWLARFPVAIPGLRG